MWNGQMVAVTTFSSGIPTRRNYLSNIVSNGVLADFIAFNFTTPVLDISLLVNTGLPSFGVELTYHDADGNLLHAEEIYGLDITYASALEGVAVVEARALMNGNQFCKRHSEMSLVAQSGNVTVGRDGSKA